MTPKPFAVFPLPGPSHRRLPVGLRLLLLALGLLPAARAQDRLKELPAYERYHRLAQEIPNSYVSGALNVTWTEDGQGLDFAQTGHRYHFDFATGQTAEVKKSSSADAGGAGGGGRRGRRRRGGGPERGRQFSSATSPDGQWRAVYRDRNLWLAGTNKAPEIAITRDGSEKDRIKYGTASWVYGEELDQNTAIWWSPDSRRVAYYRFDESHVPDFYLTLNTTKVNDTLDAEPYPKAGATNPVPDLFIYDVKSNAAVRVDVRDGRPFDNTVVGHYVYNVEWTKDGRELLFHRTNRRQNLMELCAADPVTGRCRVIVREEWRPSWTENNPQMQWLADGRRFIWTSEATGWRNYYLYDLHDGLLATLTRHDFEVENIERVDEKAGLLYYLAHDGDNPMKLQLHRVGLDGRGDVRLTDPAFHHTVDLAPDGRHFLDVAQTHDHPPLSRVVDDHGKVLATLAKSDLKKFHQLGLKTVERITFKAADGVTDLYGMLHYPSNFKPFHKYPVLVSVYGGPATTGAQETFTLPNPLTELGFLVLTLDSRSASGRGKRFMDAIYLRLGQPEIDDQAAGVRSISRRPYVDEKRVGIFGTSYGGYASAMCLLRHPDVFRAAVANSPPTAWVHYDTIYTERYMWLPTENAAGYKAGSTLTYADKLRGRLLIYYGTADNNVHPNDSMQLIQALQRAGKSFEVQVGPDQGHSAVNRDRMMEFFVENLMRH